MVSEKREAKAPPLSHYMYPATCKCPSSRRRREMVDLLELSVTAHQLVEDDDNKF